MRQVPSGPSPFTAGSRCPRLQPLAAGGHLLLCPPVEESGLGCLLSLYKT